MELPKMDVQDCLLQHIFQKFLVLVQLIYGNPLDVVPVEELHKSFVCQRQEERIWIFHHEAVHHQMVYLKWVFIIELHLVRRFH